MSTTLYIDAAHHLCGNFFVRYVMSEAHYTVRNGGLYFACKYDVKELGLQCLGKGHVREDAYNNAGGNVTFIGVLLSSKYAIKQFVAEAPLCSSCHNRLIIASKARELDDTEMFVEVAIPEPMNVSALVNAAAAALAIMGEQ